MRKFSTPLVVSSVFLLIAPYSHASDPVRANADNTNTGIRQADSRFVPFTGKVSKTKVRMRLQPQYDASILREMQPGESIVVLGETDDFYAVRPPRDFKAYIYRTFVLDDAVEGKNVNVRLKPDLDAPVVAQLNSGDPAKGMIDPENPKWLIIDMPASARFYIAKEYVEKIGDADHLTRMEEKREKGDLLLRTNEAVASAELSKPFEQMSIEGIKNNYQDLILNYQEFPDISMKAKELLVSFQEAYAEKKLQYAESRQTDAASNKKLTDELGAHKSKIARLERQIESERQLPGIPSPDKPVQLPLNMSNWLPIEQSYFSSWSAQTGNPSVKDFYDQQENEAITLRGIVDPYNRPIENKPGDYLLLNPVSKLPMAFLYSTRINLQDYVGHEVAISCVSRPNNHFAFPAYYVLSVR